MRGQRREETARFIAFRSHWRFQAEFCTPGEAHEKGGVEGESGYFRRNHWVPVPVAKDLDHLNAQLLAGCQQDEHRVPPAGYEQLRRTAGGRDARNKQTAALQEATIKQHCKVLRMTAVASQLCRSPSKP